MSECFYCKKPQEDMRPYGPGGSEICFDCMMASPEREEAAKKVFAQKLNAIDGPVVLTSDGPKKHPSGGTA